jgi:hypothetical protein
MVYIIDLMTMIIELLPFSNRLRRFAATGLVALTQSEV